MLLAAAKKHFPWHSEYIFQENNLESMACISKALKKPMLPINKEPHLVLQKLDDVIAFMMCQMHLGREVYTAGDLLDPVQQGISSSLQTPQNNAQSSGRAPKTSTKTIFTTESATKQGTLLQQ